LSTTALGFSRNGVSARSRAGERENPGKSLQLKGIIARKKKELQCRWFRKVPREKKVSTAGKENKVDS